MWALLDRRLVVALVTSVFGLTFSVVRLEGLGGGPASFVVAGDQFVRVGAAPAGLPVTHGPGYDGQFFCRHLGLRARRVGVRRLSVVVRFAELAFVVAAALATAWSLPRSRALAQEKLAWALGLGIAVLGSRSVWVEDWAFLRALAEPYLLGILVLSGRPDRRGLPIFTAGAVLCVLVAALHVGSL